MFDFNNIYSTEDQKYLLDIARAQITSHLLKGKSVSLEKIQDKFFEERSCFVTLHSKNGSLRGCIGNIEPIEALINNLLHNALNAAFHDPRFIPLSSIEELNSLNIEISILTVPKPIDSYKEFELGRHGIILEKNNAKSVFLPQVAPEQDWNVSTTLTHLAMKAGLPPDAWKNDNCSFKVFEAIYFKEKE